MVHVAVAQLCHGQVHQDSSMSFASLLLHSALRGVRVSPGKASASIVGNARNAAVAGALAMGATHVLMIDSDMIYPSWLLEEYLRHDVEVIGCPYRRRGPPWGMMGEPVEGQDILALGVAKQPIKFKWLAGGLMMVKTEVFRKMEPPYFYHSPDPQTGWAQGEDLQFSQALTDLGIPIHGITYLDRVGHIIEAVLWNDVGPITPVELYDRMKQEAANGAGSREPG